MQCCCQYSPADTFCCTKQKASVYALESRKQHCSPASRFCHHLNSKHHSANWLRCYHLTTWPKALRQKLLLYGYYVDSNLRLHQSLSMFSITWRINFAINRASVSTSNNPNFSEMLHNRLSASGGETRSTCITPGTCGRTNWGSGKYIRSIVSRKCKAEIIFHTCSDFTLCFSREYSSWAVVLEQEDMVYILRELS